MDPTFRQEQLKREEGFRLHAYIRPFSEQIIALAMMGSALLRPINPAAFLAIASIGFVRAGLTFIPSFLFLSYVRLVKL